MTHQFEAEHQTKQPQPVPQEGGSQTGKQTDKTKPQPHVKQQLILCTNSGIKVYELSLENLAEQLKLGLEDPDFAGKCTQQQHFFKYKLSALPNEKILDLVLLRSSSGEHSSSSLLLCTNLGQYVLLKCDSYLV